VARQKVLLTDFTAGMVSKKLMGALDVPYAQHGVEELNNFVVSPDGGIKRRRGTIQITVGLGITPHADGLFGDASTPAFQVIRRGDGTNGDIWLVWAETHSPQRFRALNMRTGDEEVSDDNAAIVIGVPLHCTCNEDTTSLHAFFFIL